MNARALLGYGICAGFVSLSACDANSVGDVAAAAGGTAGAGGSQGAFAGSALGPGAVGGSIPLPPLEPPLEEEVDRREPVTAGRRLPPVSGGTLLVLRDGLHVIAADPDRDRIAIVNLRGMFLNAVVELEAGAEPGRSAEDAAGAVHVVLRGSGELASLDVETATIRRRRAVCASPRGVAFDALNDALLVACAEGRIVAVPASGDAPATSVATAVDVRDLVFTGDRLLATRFRSAELLELADDRSIARRRSLPLASGIVNRSLAPGLFDANVAWRATSLADGSLVVAHQRALRDVVDVDAAQPDSIIPLRNQIDDGVGRTRSAIALAPPGRRSGAYNGGGDGCGGIVHSAISIVGSDGSVKSSPQLANITLPVDVAVSEQGVVAVAGAGFADPALNTSLSSSGLNLYRIADLDLAHAQNVDGCLQSFTRIITASPMTAVAFAGPLLIAQHREPAMVSVFDTSALDDVVAVRHLSLGGGSALDTGHELFHRDAGGGIACASCHPEGGEDSHVWHFSDVGPRRTQPLDAGLAGTAPFHWDGKLADLGSLMSEVFSRRMGGLVQTPARVEALQSFLFGFTPPARVRAPDEAAVVRGEELFESGEVGCAVCHRADEPQNATLSIGKGEPTQVPSLRGVAYRAPYMHDGCAETLHDRFDPACGGSAHGDVSTLDAADLDALVAYLESL